jgi:26S proteasome regulatory subunit N11
MGGRGRAAPGAEMPLPDTGE